MSTVWITSDLHFGHHNILKFEAKNRQFNSSSEMDEFMIREGNANVRANDTVYILGDFAFCSPEAAAAIARRLNGHKILVRGNHDRELLTSEEFRACFKEVAPDYFLTHKGTYIHMYHFPIVEWDRCHRGSVHLYGHLHSSASGLEKMRARNVGYDCTGRVVSRLDDIVKDALTGEIKKHHV